MDDDDVAVELCEIDWSAVDRRRYERWCWLAGRYACSRRAAKKQQGRRNERFDER